MILALIDHDQGKLNPSSFEMLTLARDIALAEATTLEAVIIGEHARPLADGLQDYGVSKTHLIIHEQLDDYAPEAWASSIVQLVEGAGAVVTLGSDQGNEILAYVAAKLQLPMAANCTEVETGEVYTLTRVRWGGSLLEEAELHAEIKLLSVAPLVITPSSAPVADYEIVDVRPELSDKDLRVKVTRRDITVSDKLSLTDAKVVISGGRGVGSTEGFDKLEELAGLVDAAVGCSRAVTSLGWRPHSDQVGQTGARVAPELYIACGISGAIQHLIGCKGSKHILAINTDKDAPIVSKADYAVIGDLHEVLPAISEALREQRWS